ncbi:lytic transglycosylase domain-containing protein [Candidatus Marinarcus aquaticus]|uniref:Lytic murein transglycosylase n=1 Tax=Candidatus Marinarcus aquaticus TaxID=2044504 RepID=A0A4Q0XST7_9BACT|nr:lytic transglycosylase domain-containing protein [Candidatus Marinarcus aquaticus]RXJ60103.1 lytic murein transglycosylase [Candidatus Marinarcus aquaticus]
MKSSLLSKLFMLTLLLSNLYSSQINLAWLQEQPKSFARDFYILQFLNQEITPTQAIEALELIHNMNYKLFFAYAKKLQHDETYAVVQCLQASTKELIQTNADCIAAGLSTYEMTTLTYIQKKELYEKLKEKYPQKAATLLILNSPLPFTKLIASHNEGFFDVFNQVGAAYIKHYFNYKLPKNRLEQLQIDTKFNQTIKIIVTNLELSNLQTSLLKEFKADILTSDSLFYLGINALRHNHNELAINYFKAASQKNYLRFEKDKINFWLYQTTKDKSYLETLNKSNDINIYTLFAKEQFKEVFTNIEYDIKQLDEKSSFDVTNPFLWQKIKNELTTNYDIKKYEHLFTQEYSKPNLAYIYEKYNKYQKHYFITPYESFLKEQSTQRKALIYALAKQESHLIASAISPSYALGVMQIMPFLAKHLSQKSKESFNIYAQLNPKISITYANEHLNYLEEHLSHPLFIAYAYNGGIGFTQQMLKTDIFDLDKKEYEPYLSMELVPVDESRKYGKKVLANYFIYYNHLNPKNKTVFSTLIQTIKKSHHK